MLRTSHFFKRVNDTHGHLAGDEVLRGVSMVASMTLRGTDVFGRFGGEEFIIALINTSLDGAMIIADRVRQKIEDLTFDEIHQGLQVTVSIGVAAHVGNEDPAQTLKRADDALYRAKDTGRNRCVIAELT
ncbi:MAG: GGDEF domain-containing protein [Sedimentisphaerales bacterium]|nr:GGDEF domain-containing protein [Sedimentisphaerales bacterium]